MKEVDSYGAKIRSTYKHYGSNIALDRVDATFKPGIYGLLGANGAGKTTMMRLLCGLLKPTSGEVTLNGRNIHEMGESYRTLLGYLPQEFGYYPNFTAMDFLLYMSSLKGLNKSYAKNKSLELLETYNLLEVKDKKIKTFSGGMKQRLGIAQVFLNNPEILILDEPTSGLDPKERVNFRNRLRSFSENKIVLLSTHIVSDVEWVSDEILIIKKGNLVTKGKEQTLLQEISNKVWEFPVERHEEQRFESIYPLCSTRTENGQKILRLLAEEKPDTKATSCRTKLGRFVSLLFPWGGVA